MVGWFAGGVAALAEWSGGGWAGGGGGNIFAWQSVPRPLGQLARRRPRLERRAHGVRSALKLRGWGAGVEAPSHAAMGGGTGLDADAKARGVGLKAGPRGLGAYGIGFECPRAQCPCPKAAGIGFGRRQGIRQGVRGLGA
eukprot:5101461-Pyramimonas_sp.AAC.1